MKTTAGSPRVLYRKQDRKRYTPAMTQTVLLGRAIPCSSTIRQNSSIARAVMTANNTQKVEALYRIHATNMATNNIPERVRLMKLFTFFLCIVILGRVVLLFLFFVFRDIFLVCQRKKSRLSHFFFSFLDGFFGFLTFPLFHQSVILLY